MIPVLTKFDDFLTQTLDFIVDHELHLYLSGKFSQRVSQGDDGRFEFGKTLMDLPANVDSYGLE